jgi:hypothetical protein
VKDLPRYVANAEELLKAKKADLWVHDSPINPINNQYALNCYKYSKLLQKNQVLMTSILVIWI